MNNRFHTCICVLSNMPSNRLCRCPFEQNKPRGLRLYLLRCMSQETLQSRHWICGVQDLLCRHQLPGVVTIELWMAALLPTGPNCLCYLALPREHCRCVRDSFTPLHSLTEASCVMCTSSSQPVNGLTVFLHICKNIKQCYLAHA